MFWFKSCPKCNTGDLYTGQERFGRYIACLQCGHYLTEAVQPGQVQRQSGAPVARERSLAGVG